jgi:hypothetical protein
VILHAFGRKLDSGVVMPTNCFVVLLGCHAYGTESDNDAHEAFLQCMGVRPTLSLAGELAFKWRRSRRDPEPRPPARVQSSTRLPRVPGEAG